MKKAFLGIFICLLSIFLMSYNVFALELTQDVTLIHGNIRVNFAAPLDIDSQACSLYSQNTQLGNPNTDIICYLRSVTLEFPTRSFSFGDYLTIPIYLWNNTENNANDTLIHSLGTNSNGWDIVDVDYEQLTASGSVIYLTYRCWIAGNYNTVNLKGITGGFGTLYGKEFISTGTAAQWQPVAGVNYNQAIQNVVNAINNQTDYTSKLNEIKNSINNINNDVEESTQDAADESAETGDQSSDDATSATTGLISIISGFVSAVTSATPSDCNINGNLGHLNMGTLDMCSLPVPSFVQIIGSIILILVCIPFVIIMFNRFISLFRSFQG